MKARLSRVCVALTFPLVAGACADHNTAALSQNQPQVASLAPATAPAKASSPSANMEAPSPEFKSWVADLRREALKKGISPQTFDAAFSGIGPIPRVIELDRKQPEFTQTLWTYLARGVNDKRVEKGRQLMRENGPLLARVERTYGVQARFLVAFWGMETSYGSSFGGFPVIGALATLAHDTRRSAFFRGELFEALAILQAGHVTPNRMIGSWAGAMGHLQFMPSTFRRHAVDGDGDRKIDIWGSLPDAFSSAAHYLKDEGWNDREGWGEEVIIPNGFNLDFATMDEKKSVEEWAALGVVAADGGALGNPGARASLILPAGQNGPAFLVFDNFRVILTWNRSVLYGIAVGVLADRLDGGRGVLAKPRDEDRPLTTDEVAEFQSTLAQLGYDPGTQDGIVGFKTREALKQYQKASGQPADGYPDVAALLRLREALSRSARP